METQTTQEKRLVHHDKSITARDVTNIQTSRLHLQSLVDSYKRMRLGNSLAINEIPKLLADPQSFIFDKMTEGKDLKFGDTALRLEKSKAIEILEKPIGYTAVLNTIEDVKEKLDRIGLAPEWIAERLTYDSDGKLTVSQEYLDELSERCNQYASTPPAVKIYDLLLRIKAEIMDNEVPSLVERNQYLKNNIGEFLEKAYKWDPAAKDLVISKDIILSFNSIGRVKKWSPGGR